MSELLHSVLIHFSSGENLVAWRGMESDQVHVADAYCPHNGAHLGVGGTVRGDCIQCPFHHWRYRGGDGKLVEIPYAERKGACKDIMQIQVIK